MISNPRCSEPAAARLRRNRWREKYQCGRTAAAYRVWRRKLVRLAGFREDQTRVILEVGCGPGFFLSRIERWFPQYRILGFDIDPSSLRLASVLSRRPRLIRADAAHPPFRPGAFDAVCAFQVIEHLASPELFLGETKRILKDGGILLLSTPNPGGIAARVLDKRWQGIRHDHVSLRGPDGWAAALDAAGFKILDRGTTGLTGFPLFRWPPLALINWVPMTLFGYFSWKLGESSMIISRKREAA
jgi:SAM-dependent methyltransferase